MYQTEKVLSKISLSDFDYSDVMAEGDLCRDTIGIERSSDDIHCHRYVSKCTLNKIFGINPNIVMYLGNILSVQ